MKRRDNNRGSIELIVLGLLAALIVVLAIPLLSDIGVEVENSLNITKTTFQNAVSNPSGN